MVEFELCICLFLSNPGHGGARVGVNGCAGVAGLCKEGGGVNDGEKFSYIICASVEGAFSEPLFSGFYPDAAVLHVARISAACCIDG